MGASGAPRAKQHIDPTGRGRYDNGSRGQPTVSKRMIFAALILSAILVALVLLATPGISPFIYNRF